MSGAKPLRDRGCVWNWSVFGKFAGVWLRLPPAQSGSRFNTLTFDTFDAKSGFLVILFIFI
jgi:hypothetical protein